MFVQCMSVLMYTFDVQVSLFAVESTIFHQERAWSNEDQISIEKCKEIFTRKTVSSYGDSTR